MTDRTNHLTVVLEDDYRTDDVDKLIAAIEQMRGVLLVRVGVRSPGDFAAKQQAAHELRMKLYNALV